MKTNMQLDVYLLLVAPFTSSGLKHTHTHTHPPLALDSDLLKLLISMTQQLLISLSEKWGDLVQCTEAS